MTGHQKAVLWIGLIIVAANLVMKWSSIRSIIFGSSSGGSTSNANPNSGGISTVPGVPAPSGGGITIPFGGYSITVPLSNTSSSTKPVQVLVMATQKKQQQPGYDIVVTTAFELIGVGLMSLLAGISDQMGKVVVIVMSGFLLGWLLVNSGTLAKWVSNL
jgi:hypothetical protein